MNSGESVIYTAVGATIVKISPTQFSNKIKFSLRPNKGYAIRCCSRNLFEDKPYSCGLNLSLIEYPFSSDENPDYLFDK